MVIRTLLMWAFWIGLTASLNWQELLVGFIAALLSSWISFRLVPQEGGEKLSFVGWLRFIPTVLWEILLANISIAKMVLSPKLSINPGFVTIKTELQGERKKWWLANAITLTPGTVTADILGDRLLVHWIDIQQGTTEEQGNSIKESFEKVLR